MGDVFFFYVLYEFDAVFDGCVILECYVCSYYMVHVFCQFVHQCCGVIYQGSDGYFFFVNFWLGVEFGCSGFDLLKVWFMVFFIIF